MILSKLLQGVESLFGPFANEVGAATNVVLRQRKFTATTLAATFILGFLRKPDASDEDLARTAALVGVMVSPQAIEQRYHDRMGAFMKGLFEKALTHKVPSDKVLAPLVERFADVQILDSTTISLPPEMADQFRGCGGSHGGDAAVKVQVRLSLKTGELDAVRLEQGRDTDVATPLQLDLPTPGSLRITDMGYFEVEAFERIDKAGAYWLSPLPANTLVYDLEGTQLDFLAWLGQQGPVVDQEVYLTGQRMRCRLIAWRLPAEVAERRRRRLREQARRKGTTPSERRLARCDWAILVTNLPTAELSLEEARVLYRARWQIELLFKRWKSQGKVDEMADRSPIRCMTKLWSRLLAALLQQWIQSRLWGRPEISLKKLWDMVREIATALALALGSLERLSEVFETLERAAKTTLRRNKRKKPGTFEQLNDPSRNPYPLT